MADTVTARPPGRETGLMLALRGPGCAAGRETLELPGADDQLLLVYFAEDDATSSALDRLVGREPRALRAVGG